MELLRILCVGLTVVTGLCYAYQILYLFVPLFLRKRPYGPEKPNRYAVLIAARNEEAVLPHLLESIRAQDYPAHLVTTWVVADNCTDRTAQVAGEGGARVLRRYDDVHVGKGYALNALLQHIDRTVGLDSYDAFLVFDADNLLQPDYIRQINRLCSDGYDVFCGFRNSKNFGSSWISAGQSLWYLHDSAHLNQSRMLLGNPCAINGTGFGFTRQLLLDCGGWQFFTLTEDIEFATWYATRGYRAGYCPEAELFDEQPVTLRQSWRQRTRWVQGGIQVSFVRGGDLLRGLLRFGRTGYASLETATLSLWGYCLGLVSGLLQLVYTAITAPQILPGALLGTLFWSWGFLTLMAGLTLWMERRRIRATAAQRWWAFLTFPLYMMTYVPIALTAVFRKYRWLPIHHTLAIPTEQLTKKP